MSPIKTRNSALALGVALASLTGGQAVPALAESARLEEVVVTARRAEETVQAVPISVTAISGDVLADRKIDSGAALQNTVPSLSVYSLSRDEETFAVRGLSSANTSAQGQAPSVMVYFAQIPLPSGDGGGPGRYFDLQNVQVLKGPQGTLFGRNSTGGAVLFEPQRPTNKLEGYGQIQVGNYSDREFEGAVNLPLISDVLTSRISFKSAKRDGFTKNVTNGKDLDDRDYLGGRLSLLFTPSDSFENLFVADYFKSNTNGSSNAVLGFKPDFVVTTDAPGLHVPIILGGAINTGTLLTAAPADIPALVGQAMATQGGIGMFPLAALESIAKQQRDMAPGKVALSVDTRDKIEAWGFANTSQFNINDNLTLKNILGYRTYKQYLRSDKDGSPLVLLDGVTDSGPTVYLEQWSDELQLQGSSFDERLDWTIGAFGLTARSPGWQHDDHVYYGGTFATQDTKPRETSRSIYGQVTYDFSDVVDGLKFTAGYRYTKDHRELRQTSYTAGVCSLLPGEGVDLTGGCSLELKRNFGSGSYSLGIDYQITPDMMVYIANRRGYRSGGINTQGVAVGRGDYGPEHVSDIEIGAKADWHISDDISARTNLAVFRTKRDDAQVSQPYAVTIGDSTRLINMIVNEAEATIKGAEFDGRLIFAQGLDLSLSWAYTDASYDKYFDIRTGQLLKNMPYAFTPRSKLSLGARYQLPVPEAIGDMNVAVNWSRSSAINFNVTPDPYGKQDAYSQTDVYFNWNHVLDSTVNASLFVTNLTNRKYLVGGYPVFDAAGFSTGIYNEPRMWGMSLKYNFSAD